MTELDRAEAFALLATASLGRIVFTRNALPIVRPVNHIVDRGRIVIRTHDGAALTAQAAGAATDGVVVAYEADDIDPDTHVGWSVIVTGYARLVEGDDELNRYQDMLEPWVDGRVDYTVRIDPVLVAGFRLTDQHHSPEPSGAQAPDG